jgi:hypothetical protein
VLDLSAISIPSALISRYLLHRPFAR